MKKIISLVLFLLSFGFLLGYLFYTKNSYDYNIAQFIGYLFYWSVAFFVVSLFAFMLDYKKYKIWLRITLIYVFISILIAYKTGSGSQAIVNFDGKLLTWIFVCFYSFISIIYFIVQFIKSRNNNIR